MNFYRYFSLHAVTYGNVGHKKVHNADQYVQGYTNPSSQGTVATIFGVEESSICVPST